MLFSHKRNEILAFRTKWIELENVFSLEQAGHVQIPHVKPPLRFLPSELVEIAYNCVFNDFVTLKTFA